jgi:outer membrane PBP1 activator LpoA protein
MSFSRSRYQHGCARNHPAALVDLGQCGYTEIAQTKLILPQSGGQFVELEAQGQAKELSQAE